ncbi:MAG: glycosyl hydrolase 53 family protein [Oscillospiraceae bacterium]|nr:glycosyl hydrolase 53 family protein [Oscillospiraceae bacterium]
MKNKLFAFVLSLSIAVTELAGCSGNTSKSDAFDFEFTSYDDYGVRVSQIDGLSDDFIFGADLSSIIEVENAGGKFYYADGAEGDIFEILASYGINYVRIRLWNDPFDENGNSFGGGGNDVETDIQIAKRAVEAGMKVCLDFHYSDFWADPSKQTLPREWANYNSEDLRQVVYDYTYDVLKEFEAAGCLPSMVQTGNEVNNGIMLPNGSSRTYQAIYMASAMSAVKAVDEGIKTVVHLAEGASYSTLSGILDDLIYLGLDFDVIGLSYYSYWHGSMSEFKDCVERLSQNYSQEICVMEYSYGYGDDSNEYTANIFSSEGNAEDGGYLATVQGQASYIHDVNETVASVETGIGSFYWEPAWLPLSGTSWASEYAHEYLVSQGDGGGEGAVSWANQALFDFSGNPLDSLNAYKLMKNSTAAEENVLEINTEIYCDVDLSKSSVELPSSVTALTDLDRWVELEIDWNEDEISALSGSGQFTVTGTADCGGNEYAVTAHVNAFYDYLKNGSFEVDGITSDEKDFSNVSDWSMDGTSGSYRIESKNARTGGANLNIWCSSAYENTLSQEIFNLSEGEYTLSVYARSGMENYKYPDCTLFVEIDGEAYEAEIQWGESWSDWVQTSVAFTISGTQNAVIGIKSSGDAGTWAHFDDFTLSKSDE